MATVVWLPEAAADVARLRQFLIPNNPDAARDAAVTIKQAALQLEEYPESGVPMNDGSGRRELFTPFGSGAYVLRYKLQERIVAIIRVWHSREDR